MQTWTLDIYVREQLTRLLAAVWQEYRQDHERQLTFRPEVPFDNAYMDHLWLYVNVKLNRLPVACLLKHLPGLRVPSRIEAYLEGCLKAQAARQGGFINVQWTFALDPYGDILATGKMDCS